MSIQPLFHPRTLRKALSTSNILKEGNIPPKALKILTRWQQSIEDGSIHKESEGNLHAQFYSLICEGVLGYKSSINKNKKTKKWTLVNEKAVKKSGRVDVGLGLFSEKESSLIAPFELKSPKTSNLDVPMGGRKESAVAQAARYARNSQGQAKWFIVSNCLEIRLYKYPYSDSSYQCWQIAELVQPEKYAEFVLLLGEKNLLEEQTERLFQASQQIEKEITHALYSDYREVRIKLINGMKRENNRFRRASMVTRAQTLLDRVLFVAYAEDCDLLPDKTLSHYLANKGMQTSWEALKLLFRHIDKGDKARGIPKYNGDLFKPDESLETLEISDELIAELQCLWEYDFSTDVSVTILGHIFEQSIADLDQIYDVLDEDHELLLTQQKVGTSGKRKQEGVVYTPDFITEWIVKETLGGYLKKKRAEIAHPEESLEWWQAYRTLLATMRILDPACGSGAFLVAAYHYLKQEYAFLNERLRELGAEGGLFSLDLNSDILNNNLFGVDINAESVEIARLSLWLVTAEKGKPLTSLKENIRQGNSIVADRDLDKQAFRWIGRFKEFDVILGNPPYVRQERLTPIKPHLESHYETYHGVADLYSYFFELGLRLLKKGGSMGYISSSTFFKTGSGENLRRFLQVEANLKTVVNFGDLQIFKGVTTYPAMLVMEKPSRKRTLPPKEYPFRFLNVVSKNVADLVGELQEADFGQMKQAKLGLEGWRLEDDRLSALRGKILKNKKTLKEVYGSPQYGIKTGRNEAFVIDEQTRDRLISEDPKSLNLIKPFLEGKDLKKWHSEPRNIYLIFTRRGVDIKQYPAIKAYLEQYREILEPKPKKWSGGKWLGRKGGAYKWYEIQDTVNYYEKFNQEKVIYVDIGSKPSFVFDSTNYCANTAYFISNGGQFLLGLLNSNVFWFVITGKSNAIRGGFYRLFSQYMEKIPIPNATEKQKEDIAALAEQCQATAEKRYQIENSLRCRIPDLCPDDREAKLSKKLQAWWTLDFSDFQKEIKRLFKQALSLSEKTEWEMALKQGKEQIQILACQLAEQEAELNQQVYHLFGLSAEEIQLLEQSIK